MKQGRFNRYFKKKNNLDNFLINTTLFKSSTKLQAIVF